MFDLPFRIIIGFFRGFTEVIDWVIQSLSRNSQRPLWLTILMLPVLVPYWLGWSLYTVLAYPISLARLEPERRINLYWGIPSLIMMVLSIVAGTYTMSSSQNIDSLYLNAMKRAYSAQDYKLASILGGRLVTRKMAADQETLLNYALALIQSGEVSRGNAILADLAPNDVPGYSPAHRVRARYFAEQLQKGSSDAILEQLRWHLENSGDDTNVGIERLWTAYFVKVGQPEEALPHMEQAAKLEPRLLITLANLYRMTNNKSGEIRTLRIAESQFIKKLKSDPLAREDRLQLVMAQTKLDKPEAAEETMMMGVQLHNDAKIRRSAAEFYVLLHSTLAESNPKNIVTQFALLEKSLALDPYCPEIYEKLILLYQRVKETEEAKKIQTTLEEMLVEGQSPALVHFTLSSIYQIQGDSNRSEKHLFQSYRLDGKFPLVTNNLAWMLAHRENPDLAGAYELAVNAVQAMPKDPRFRDTLATILMFQGKSYDALAEFEAIIDKVSDKKSIHRKLAELYRKIDDPRMAEKHDIKADELAKIEADKAKESEEKGRQQSEKDKEKVRAR